MSQVRTSNKVYSDLNAYYGQDVASNYSLVYNENVLNQGILSILTTRRGSRIFNRDFGSILMDLLFDPVDEVGSLRIKTEILSALRTWEPRVDVESVIVLPDIANQQYYVELHYKVPTLNGKQVEFTFNLSQATRS